MMSKQQGQAGQNEKNRAKSESAISSNQKKSNEDEDSNDVYDDEDMEDEEEDDEEAESPANQNENETKLEDKKSTIMDGNDSKSNESYPQGYMTPNMMSHSANQKQNTSNKNSVIVPKIEPETCAIGSGSSLISSESNASSSASSPLYVQNTISSPVNNQWHSPIYSNPTSANIYSNYPAATFTNYHQPPTYPNQSNNFQNNLYVNYGTNMISNNCMNSSNNNLYFNMIEPLSASSPSIINNATKSHLVYQNKNESINYQQTSQAGMHLQAPVNSSPNSLVSHYNIPYMNSNSQTINNTMMPHNHL